MASEKLIQAAIVATESYTGIAMAFKDAAKKVKKL
jgi:hypothetical protein